MTRETFLKNKITQEGSIKDFAIKIDMAYTTLLSILKNVGGASIDNIFKICHGLGITADDLNNCVDTYDISKSTTKLNSEEKQIISSYRKLNEEGKHKVRENIEDILSNPKNIIKNKNSAVG